MDIFHFTDGAPARRLESIDRIPDDGLVWIDVEREAAEPWPQLARDLLGVEVDPEHIEDAETAAHPPRFDGTPEYDLLVFPGLGPRDDPIAFETRVAAFFLFERMLLTVRAHDNISFAKTKKRFESARQAQLVPASPVCVAHAILDTMVDRYLAIREPLINRVRNLEEELLEPQRRENYWRPVLELRRAARRLDMLCEAQEDALDAWRRGSRFEWDRAGEVRIHDLMEHVNRVRVQALATSRDLDSAMQIHFSAVAQRTNDVVRVLTVLTVIGTPPMILAGIWGMNFQVMPELHWKYGYPVALATMVGACLGLWAWLKRRNLF